MILEVSIIMGSKSDYPTMRVAEAVLEEFQIGYETQIVSAHRTPDMMFRYAEEAKSKGIKIIIAGAGGAAHLPGMVAAKTTLPVLGVPIKSKELNGIDSLLSIAQMPYGVPVGCLAVGEAGAKNAALLACQILALNNKVLEEKLVIFRKKQAEKVLHDKL
jgi:5-(carboxyamino)imidazole ribonucleotide mutase